jgi:hypothetical protein
MKKTKKKAVKAKPTTQQKAIALQNNRIKLLKMTATGLEASNNVLRDSINEKTATLDAITVQVSLAENRLQNIINETAVAMIQHDEFTEKVRVAKVAAMNVYGTLSVVQRDLKTVIDAPGPDSTTPDVMDALLEGDLHLETPEPIGEVSKMVEDMFGDTGTDTQRKGVFGFPVEYEATDLGLILENGQMQPPDPEVSLPMDIATVSSLFDSAEQAIQDLRTEINAETLAEAIILAPPADEVAKIKSPTSAHLKTRPSYDPKRDLAHIANSDDRLASDASDLLSRIEEVQRDIEKAEEDFEGQK